MKRHLKTGSLVVIVAILVLVVATFAQAQSGVTATPNGNVRIRSGAGDSYAQIGTAPSGASLPVFARSADSQWVIIEHDGVRGWVAAWLTTITGDINSVPVSNEVFGSPVWVTTQIPLKMRTGPGFEFPDTLGTVPALTTVPALARTANTSWFLVEYNGVQGWIAGWLVWYEGDLSLIPISDQTVEGGAPVPPPPAPENPPTGNQPSQPAPPPPSPGGVTATPQFNLRIRSEPTSSSQTLGTAPFNVALPVSGRTADSSWVFIDYNGTKGWIAAWMSNISGDLNSVPVTSQVGAGGPPAAGPPPVPGGLPPVGGFQLGGQTHTLEHPNEMHYAGMGWVKFQHKWGPGQSPNDLAGRIQQAHANGFRVLLSIPGGSYPTSIDYGAYTSFVAGVAALGADGIEIWNEMNLSREWPAGQIDPTSYVNNMLRPAYIAIKQANPNTLVVGGAPAPTGVHDGVTVWRDDLYIAGMANAGAANYMDCMGVHYNAGATSPDAVVGHPADGGGGHYSWYFWPTYALYANTFPGEKLCYTEVGYVTGEGYGSLPAAFWWGGGNTVGEQAEWLARSAQHLRGTGRVTLMIVFNVDFTHWGDDPQAGYAMIRPGGGCPACQTLHDVMN